MQPFAAFSPMMGALTPDLEALERAVHAELQAQGTALLKGIQTYLAATYDRQAAEGKPIWQDGTTRLLDYGVEGEEQATALFIPSLINRHYILDLLPECSMVRFLRAQGIRPLLIDWGDPGAAEEGFSCTDYVMQRIIPAMEAARGATQSPLMLTGYCMGGLLALAAAQLAETKPDGLALFATPWDFHSPNFARVPLDSDHIAKLEALLSRSPTLPGTVLQTLFYATSPWSFAQKYAKFSTFSPKSPEAKHFVAREAWVNDNVDMPSATARECLIDWSQHNATARGNWKVGEQTIRPEAMRHIPTFCALPTRDTVVPQDSAQALATALPHATICRPHAGHVGMVAGAHAKEGLWEPYVAWIKTCS
ncbi:MAG: alpha/beta fold hydrolase [Rickettsiales bacterium]